MTDDQIPHDFLAELARNYILVTVSGELLADSSIPDIDLFLSDPREYRRLHPYVPPSRKQRLKTWIGARREKLGEKLYETVAGIPFPDDSW
jgi:hypothetical protein